MAQEEHTSRCSNNSSSGGGGGGGGSGGGHRSSKKLKHKKVPQRGMGVAQLEKIISEEHQKNDSGSSIPPPPPLPPNHYPLVSKADGGNVNNVSGSKNLISGGGNWSRLWSGGGEYKLEGEKLSQSQSFGLDHSRYTAPFPANLGGLPYESNPPIWPPAPNLMLQRSQQFQQPGSSSMVNASVNSSSSSTLSSVMSFQIEPPSNQSYCGNNYQPLWPEEEKMVGMKRSYPFSLENAPIPSFQCKFPSAYVSPITRSDEYASCSNRGGSTSIEPVHPAFREHCSSTGAISDAITKKFIDENQILTRDFLKLAPPQTSQSNSNSKESLQLSPCTREQPQLGRLPIQKDQLKDPTHLSARNVSNLQPFLSYFPAAKTPMGHPGSSNGDAGESVDLNLKL